MNRLLGQLLAVAVVMGASSMVLAQRGPGGGPPMRMPAMMNGGALDPVIHTLGELNLRPGFTLSEEQKAKVQAIRDAYKASQDKWRTDHAAELSGIQEAMTGLLDQGPDADPEAWREVMDQSRALYETAPSGEAEVEQVRAVLTKEQAEALEARESELAAERQRMMEEMGGGRGRGPGGQGGRGPGGRDGQGPREGQGPRGGQGPGGERGERGDRPGV